MEGNVERFLKQTPNDRLYINSLQPVSQTMCAAVVFLLANHEFKIAFLDIFKIKSK